jgi:hypothetical protein
MVAVRRPCHRCATHVLQQLGDVPQGQHSAEPHDQTREEIHDGIEHLRPEGEAVGGGMQGIPMGLHHSVRNVVRAALHGDRDLNTGQIRIDSDQQDRVGVRVREGTPITKKHTRK